VSDSNVERAWSWFRDHIWMTHESSPVVLARLLDARDAEIREEIAVMARMRDEALAMADRLGHSNSEMCDRLFEADQRIKELEAELAKLREGKAA